MTFLRPFYFISADGELILDASFAMTQEFKMKSMINWLKQHSILISFVTEKYNSFNKQRLIRKMEGLKNKEKIKGALTLSTANPDPVYAENYKLNKRLIKEIADFCREKGIKFMLVSLNTDDYMPEVENKYKSIDLTFDMYFFYDDMMNYTRQLDIEYLGLQKAFREQY